MFKLTFSALLCLALFSGAALPLSGQSNDLRVAVANMTQDLNLLTQQVKTMRLEMEELRRENARLRAQVTAAGNASQTEAQISRLSGVVDSLQADYRSADETQKQQIIIEVTRQINALAKEMQAAINTVAEAVGSEPQVATTVHFSEDYPKTGKPYVVRSGDTLSGIARQHKSTVKDIQNANKIVNPSRDLKVGETIFIPISQ